MRFRSIRLSALPATSSCMLLPASSSRCARMIPILDDGLKVEAAMPTDPMAASKFDHADQERVAGRVVLVERGGLKIAQKVLHCEEAGALASATSLETISGR